MQVVDLNRGGDQLRTLPQLVGGYIEVQAHPEGDIVVNNEGRLIDLPVNPRLNHWMLNASQRARESSVGESMVMYGDVVLTGSPDGNGDITPVSDELVHYTEGLEVAPEAMKDWDTET